MPEPTEEPLAHLRAQLAEMLGQIDTHGPLPAPTRFVNEADDPMPGAHWCTGARGTRGDARVDVIAGLDDVGQANPSVFLRGVSPADLTDVEAFTREEARAIALALLAAADMTGSPLIAQHCRKART